MKRLTSIFFLTFVMASRVVTADGSAPPDFDQVNSSGDTESTETSGPVVHPASAAENETAPAEMDAPVELALQGPSDAPREESESSPVPDKPVKKKKLVEPEPSDASYVLSRGVLKLGEARFQLTRQTDNPACWRYQTTAKPSGLAKLLIGKVSERSDFCMADGKVISQYFEFIRSDDQDESFSLEFDWKDAVVRSSAGDMRPLESGMIDRLAMQIAVQNWVVEREGKVGPETITLTKVEDDRIKAYSFQIMAKEKIETPAGVFDTIRVERVNDPKKKTLFWLAPSRGYLAVRVEQIKKGSEQLKMLLKH